MEILDANVSTIFNEKDDIYRAFHCILALNTGNISYNVDFYDYDNANWNPMVATPKGKQLNIAIQDTCQSFNWQSEPCQSTSNDMSIFSFDKLKKKKQEEWTDLDYEIAQKFIECYGEFVLDGKRFYAQNIQLGKAHLLNLKDVLQKAKKSDEWISEKIAYLIKEEGYPRDQAVAIAYSMAGRSKKKKSLIDNFYDFVKSLINEGASKQLIEEILTKNFLENKELNETKDFSNDLFQMIDNDYIVKHDTNRDCLMFDEINKNSINGFKDIIKAIVNKIISNDLEKSKKFPPGTIRNWGGKNYKKISEGKWEEVKKPGSGEKKEDKDSKNKEKMINKIKNTFDGNIEDLYEFAGISNDKINKILSEMGESDGYEYLDELADKKIKNMSINKLQEAIDYINGGSIEDNHNKEAKVNSKQHEIPLTRWSNNNVINSNAVAKKIGKVLEKYDMKTDVEYDSAMGATFFEVTPKGKEGKVFEFTTSGTTDEKDIKNQLKDLKSFLNNNDLDINVGENQLVITKK